jgi:hypothetical protein
MEAIGGGLLGFGIGSLFGGGGGGGSSGRVTGQVMPSVQTASTLSSAQSSLLNKLINLASPQIGQIGRVPPSSLGPAGPSSLQQQAFQFAGGLPNYLQSPAFANFDPSQITSAMAPVGQYARQGFQQETIPAIMSALGATGTARSSGAADILGREGRNLELGLASQFAPMQYQGLQEQLNRQAMLPSLAAQMGTQLSNIGTVQRGISGEQQAYELERYMQQDPLRNPAISLALQTIGIPTYENIAFGGMQGYRQPSTFESLLPAIGAIGGGLMGGIGQAGGWSSYWS